MSLLMTSTPLAMIACGFEFSDSAMVISAHVIGMFAPSFFTGNLIIRHGPLKIILIGVIINVICVGVDLAGVHIANFAIGLFLLGVGWNFMFIGATTLLTEVHSPSERAKIQGFNDFLIFGTITMAALSSGNLLHFFGWQIVNYGVLPFLVAVLLLVLWLARSRHSKTSAA